VDLEALAPAFLVILLLVAVPGAAALVIRSRRRRIEAALGALLKLDKERTSVSALNCISSKPGPGSPSSRGAVATNAVVPAHEALPRPLRL